MCGMQVAAMNSQWRKWDGGGEKICTKLGTEHQYVMEKLVRSRLSNYITARSLEEDFYIISISSRTRLGGREQYNWSTTLNSPPPQARCNLRLSSALGPSPPPLPTRAAAAADKPLQILPMHAMQRLRYSNAGAGGSGVSWYPDGTVIWTDTNVTAQNKQIRRGEGGDAPEHFPFDFSPKTPLQYCIALAVWRCSRAQLSAA